MSGLDFDVRTSVRYLRKNALLWWLATATLGLGLGIASALFAALDALYFRPLPVDVSRSVVVVRATHDRDITSVSRADMNDTLANTRVEAFGGMRDWTFALQARGREEPVTSALATEGFFRTFRVTPHLGRLFRDDEGRAVLVSFSAWRQRFGADPLIVGKIVTLNGDAFVVAGVLPEQFTAPSFSAAEFWAPLSCDPDMSRGRAFRNLIVYARLPSGGRIDGVRKDLAALAGALQARYPESNRGWSLLAVPLIEYQLGGVSRQLVILAAATTLLLLMVLANLATLILSESVKRRAEYGIRAALGGTAFRLARQSLLDALLLCLPGATVAALLAGGLVWFLKPVVSAGLPGLHEIAPDASMLFFSFAVLMAISLILAGLSMWWSGQSEPAQYVEQASRALSGGSHRGNAILVTIQVALACALLASGFQLIRGYLRRTASLGDLEADSILLLRVRASEDASRRELVAAAREAAATLAAVPGVTSVAIGSAGPLFGGREELEVASDAVSPYSLLRFANVDQGYFATMRIPLLAGRAFGGDSAAGDPVVVITRSVAGRFFPAGDAIGRQLWLGSPKPRAHRVIGVVAESVDPRGESGGGVEIYVSFERDPRQVFFVILRGIMPSELPGLHGLMVMSRMPMGSLRDRVLLLPRLQMGILALFGVGAAVFATMAVFGCVSLVVSTRREEIALRLALGATARGAERLLLVEVMRPVGLGIGIGGLVLFIALTRLRELVGGLSMTGPVVGTAVALVALAIVASIRMVRATARVVE